MHGTEARLLGLRFACVQATQGMWFSSDFYRVGANIRILIAEMQIDSNLSLASRLTSHQLPQARIAAGALL
jgi:hypothetical protein